jgi:hypothetical protein
VYWSVSRQGIPNYSRLEYLKRAAMDTERGESSLLTLIGRLATQSVKDAGDVVLAQTHNSPRLTLRV